MSHGHHGGFSGHHHGGHHHHHHHEQHYRYEPWPWRMNYMRYGRRPGFRRGGCFFPALLCLALFMGFALFSTWGFRLVLVGFIVVIALAVMGIVFLFRGLRGQRFPQNNYQQFNQPYQPNQYYQPPQGYPSQPAPGPYGPQANYPPMPPMP